MDTAGQCLPRGGLASSGGVDGGSHVTSRFKEMPMSHVSGPYFSFVHMSNLRKSLVTCHYLLNLMFHVGKAHVVMSRFKK